MNDSEIPVQVSKEGGRRSSQTITMKMVSAWQIVLANIVQLLIGTVFVGGGGWLAYYSLAKENHMMVYVGIGVSVFGAMLLPSVFPVARNIYITFFPNGLPLIGGRRQGDPPSPDQP
jgi:hypothetical protein